MKRTLFSLGKQVVRTRGYSTAQLNQSSNLIAKFLNIFSNETRETVSNEITHTLYKFSLKEVQNNIQIGRELIADRAKRDPLGSIEAFEKSAKIADTILENYALESLSLQNKVILGQAYAGYADVLRKFEPEKIERRKEMVKKALELDPENEIAKELSFDMRFYDIVPEPPRM